MVANERQINKYVHSGAIFSLTRGGLTTVTKPTQFEPVGDALGPGILEALILLCHQAAGCIPCQGQTGARGREPKGPALCILEGPTVEPGRQNIMEFLKLVPNSSASFQRLPAASHKVPFSASIHRPA